MISSVPASVSSSLSSRSDGADAAELDESPKTFKLNQTPFPGEKLAKWS